MRPPPDDIGSFGRGPHSCLSGFFLQRGGLEGYEEPVIRKLFARYMAAGRLTHADQHLGIHSVRILDHLLIGLGSEKRPKTPNLEAPHELSLVGVKVQETEVSVHALSAFRRHRMGSLPVGFGLRYRLADGRWPQVSAASRQPYTSTKAPGPITAAPSFASTAARAAGPPRILAEQCLNGGA
jgi:hypothetical protein